jgi:hypothetical protein
MKSQGFKFKNTGATASDHEVTLLNDFEIISLIVEKIKDVNIWKFLEFYTIIEIFYSEDDVKIYVRKARKEVKYGIKNTC